MVKGTGETFIYLVQFGLIARKGKCEAQRQLLVLYLQLIHETGQAFCNVVKKLQDRQEDTWSEIIPCCTLYLA